MDIRKASEGDIPLIVDLLKKSLGESLLPKSETYWRWKHLENPFGHSPVIVAYEDQKLVGVRAFMCWQWKQGVSPKQAVRAVDTATHPDYQGKGIFKKLTLRLLEDCKANGTSFVFNTPNEQSMPGYLKMGWQKAGRLPVNFKILRPFTIGLKLTGLYKERPFENESTSPERDIAHPDCNVLLQQHQKFRHDRLITAHTAGSLRWRYVHVPVVRYYSETICTGTQLNGLLFYRLKSSKAGIEMRVTDVFMESEQCRREIYDRILAKAKMHKADYLSIAGDNSFLKGLLSFKKLSVGPIVTVRTAAGSDLSLLQNFKAWEPSLGDLELF